MFSGLARVRGGGLSTVETILLRGTVGVSGLSHQIRSQGSVQESVQAFAQAGCLSGIWCSTR